MTTPFTSVWRALGWLVLFGSTAQFAGAQTALAVEHNGKMYPVVKVGHGFAYVKEGDKLVSVQPSRSLLVPQPEFLPLFVSVRDLQVKTSAVEFTQTANVINNEFHFNATFESSYRMENPFLVLELDMEKAGKRLFFQEIGELTPGHPQWVRVTVALPEQLGAGKFKLHIFTDGFEVFNSQQPWQFREGVLNKMVMKRLAGVQDAPPRPFVGPVPEYPAALRKSHLAGEAVVTVHITRLGVVLDPKLASASDPAFGQAAVAAVGQWRFLPQVKNGHPVETFANMPFTFTAPPADEKH